VRSLVAREGGMSSAGIFDAAWTLSMTYVTLITTAFGTYYLPALSGLDNRAHRQELMQRMFRFVTVLIVPLILGVIVLKPLLLQILFSAEFLPAISLIALSMSPRKAARFARKGAALSLSPRVSSF
jgi:PST family polysaccharide transporter